MIDPVTDRSAAAFLEQARAVHLFRVTGDGTIDACNEAAAEHLGHPSHELAGRSVLDFLTAPDAQRLREELRAGGRRSEPLLLNFCGPAQLPYTLHCWLDVEGGRATIVGEPPLAGDRALQGELMKVTQDLALLARERTKLVAAERQARREAEGADREKDRALASIAHEIRQPLGAMRFAVEILASAAPAAARERALQTLQRQTAHLTRMVDDLLDVARVRENKLRLARARLDLAALLADLGESFRARAASGGIDLTCALPDGPVLIHGDSARLVQVFSNILDNAIKYTGAGGSIAVDLGRDVAMAAVRVRDTGRGIGPDVLPRIFQLFAQEGEGERGGLGLGLAISHGIVTLHGGSIEARSAGPGQGSEFMVRLPLADAAAGGPG